MKFDNLIMMVIFLVVSIAGGLIAGVIYFDMTILQTELEKIDVDIPLAQNSTNPDAINITTLQDVFDLTIYPILTLKDALPFLVYFMMFAFIIALAISAYMSSKNPVFFVLHLLFTLVISYFAILISNAYAELLSDSFINSMMTEFPVYNILMLYLPQIFFLTSIVFATIAFVNVIKPTTQSSPYGLNYGGDY